jgi:hypothetical protein
VGVPADRGLFRPLDQLGEGRGAGEVHAQRQGVDEEADQGLAAGVRTTGDRHADHQVALAGPATQHRAEDCQENHEGGRAGAMTQVANRDAVLFGQHGTDPPADRLPGRRAPPPGRQDQRGRRTGQVLAPVAQLPFETLAGQPPPLPHREVEVLDVERRQAGAVLVAAGGVQCRQLPPEQRDRPVVADDVVRGDAEDVLGVAQPDQHAAHQRAALQIERRHRVLVGQPDGRGGGFRDAVEVHDPDVPGLVQVVDELDRPAVDGREPRAQDLVAVQDRPHARVQRSHVQGSGQPLPPVHVVRRAGK